MLTNPKPNRKSLISEGAKIMNTYSENVSTRKAKETMIMVSVAFPLDTALLLDAYCEQEEWTPSRSKACLKFTAVALAAILKEKPELAERVKAMKAELSTRTSTPEHSNESLVDLALDAIHDNTLNTINESKPKVTPKPTRKSEKAQQAA
jgi:hypothetical protein